jgi:hypothetical protein
MEECFEREKREREEAEAKRKAEKEYNDRQYKELINDFTAIAAKPINDNISSTEYRSRIDTLARIKSGLKNLPGTYDTAMYLEKCNAFHGLFAKELPAADKRAVEEHARQKAEEQRQMEADQLRRSAIGGLIGAVSGGAAAFLFSLIVGYGDNGILGGFLVLVGLIAGGISIPKIFDSDGCLVTIIGAIAGGVLFGAVIFQGIPQMRYESGLPGVCAIGAVIGAVIGCVVGWKTY